ncbi:fimbria/pilus periplasmic chaperone [Phytobacter sp. V91]|uniref:fimbria/pilus periplasmic chaperone n=1 Tax=Phytobacter sp. V91 TaxID=3369425 RepID=UPI003F61AF13
MSVSRVLIVVTALLLPFMANAGGVGLGATRLVYPAGGKQVSLDVRNTHETAPFLIQSWLDNANNVKTADFVVVPPLSVLRPKGENTLRIMFVGRGLPQDRETLYWMTVKAIPQSAPAEKNTLQMAAASRIKVFYRPANLPVSPADAWKRLTGTFQAGKVTLNNPTPYYITLSSLKVDGKKITPMMISPKSNVTLTGTFSAARSFEYQTVNDFGAWTSAMVVNIK